jgi:hypothetical protein
MNSVAKIIMPLARGDDPPDAVPRWEKEKLANQGRCRHAGFVRRKNVALAQYSQA